MYGLMTRQQRLVAACSALVVFAELLGMGMAMLLSSLLSNDVAGLVGGASEASR